MQGCHQHHGARTSVLSRRQLLRTTLSLSGGLSGILLTKTPPVYAARRTLTMLTWQHFIKVSDDILQQMAESFGRANNCQVRIDFIPHKDTRLMAPKEQQARRGHDIIFLLYSMAHLYHEDLETLDFMDALGHRLGGWYDLAREVGQVRGRWVAMPWYCSAQVMTYREDLYQQHGFPPPQTWEAWKKTGHKIRESSGHMVGVTLNEDTDSNLTLYALLWSYGASTVEADGRVSIDAPGTRRALDYIKDLYACCMPDDVLSWDASGNNQAFLSGEYAWVHNPTSIYGYARHNASKLREPKLLDGMNHTLTPRGPGGQHGTVTPSNYGIWRFAKEKELARAFLQSMMDLERMEWMFHATATYNTPLFKKVEGFDWDRDPKTALLKDCMKTAHMMGWPAASDHRAEQAVQQHIVPKMFTAYATGQQSLSEAVAWGEAALQRIYQA